MALGLEFAEEMRLESLAGAENCGELRLLTCSKKETKNVDVCGEGAGV